MAKKKTKKAKDAQLALSLHWDEDDDSFVLQVGGRFALFLTVEEVYRLGGLVDEAMTGRCKLLGHFEDYELERNHSVSQ